MADLRQVRTRIATAHTALTVGAAVMGDLTTADTSALSYMQRELHKILGRLEALDAGLAHMTPDKRKRKVTLRDVMTGEEGVLRYDRSCIL